ncbi:hypothetical protein PILCRDRAFT_76386 [Piloderma croceum F 1598]|uniref:G domain-containing protein n=1 Tax=Piloderma croceum (strain F 1598) TaxID=765440 RepID=A0A0C3FD89_PILCF|nr:hypothetical protein PILCRDRAFT_76386 [Piloderma croceum F 1598]
MFAISNCLLGLESKSKPATRPSTDDDHRAKKIREKAGRFRVLVIGRANAGKTTILQKVCNTTDQPEIFDSSGKNIKTSVITPTALRGIHNIENELVFRSNPGFIFHDSRGFEAGCTSELDTVNRFIAERSKEPQLSSQLHIIWQVIGTLKYCIPMDDERPFTAAELSFFSECGTGSVPVVVLFTKFDALEDKAYGDLAKHYPHEDAVAQAPARAVADFENQHLPRVYRLKYPPKGHVYLRDLNKAETDCRELTETIAAVLGDDNLRRLFVSMQKNNLQLCMEYAIKR